MINNNTLPNGEHLCQIEDIFNDSRGWVFALDICKGKYKDYFKNRDDMHFLYFPNDKVEPELVSIVNAVMKVNPDFLTGKVFKSMGELLDALVGEKMMVNFITVERIHPVTNRRIKVLTGIYDDREDK